MLSRNPYAENTPSSGVPQGREPPIEADPPLGGKACVCRHRGVTAEIDLHGRREPPEVVIDARLHSLRNEAGLGLPKLSGKHLHLLVGQAIGSRHHPRGVAGEGDVREGVDDVDWPTQANLRVTE